MNPQELSHDQIKTEHNKIVSIIYGIYSIRCWYSWMLLQNGLISMG